MIRREQRHRTRREPCECRRGFVPCRLLPKPWYAAFDWLQVVCSLILGLVGWLILFGAVSHAYLIDASLLPMGLFLWALAWLAAGMCAWWSVEQIFEATNEEDESIPGASAESEESEAREEE